MAKHKEKPRQLHCPFCDAELMEANFPFCQACRVAIFYCPRCREPVPRDQKVCPHCGAEIRDEIARGGR